MLQYTKLLSNFCLPPTLIEILDGIKKTLAIIRCHHVYLGLVALIFVQSPFDFIACLDEDISKIIENLELTRLLVSSLHDRRYIDSAPEFIRAR